MHLVKSSCRGALNWGLCDDHLIKAITFLQLELPGECWVPAIKRKVQALGVSLQPHMFGREPRDVLQCWQTAEERRTEDGAFVLGCYCSTMEPTKGNATCLCQKKR